MNRIRAWKPSMKNYEELFAIECSGQDSIDRIIEALWAHELRTCPRHIVASAVIIPKEALRFLPLKEIKHRQVELRDVGLLKEAVMREVHRRFLAKGKEQPHFFTTGKGRQRTICRSWVPLDTIRAIEAKKTRS